MADGVNKLSEDQLYQCLISLNVPNQFQEVQTPTKEFMIRVFECLLKDLQIDILHINLRPFTATKHIEHPELFEEGQSIILLVMFINIITITDGLTLYARDVIFPKPKRTKKILNYLIVFWKHYLMKLASFQALVEKFQVEKKESDDLSEENDQLVEKYNELLSILKNEPHSKEELISCHASKREKSIEMDKQREALTEENNALKKKEQDLQSLLSTTDVNIVTAKEQIKELEELILSSPEKISNEIKKVKDLIREEELKMREKETDLKEKKKNLDTLKQLIENCAKDLEEVKHISKTLETFGDIMRNFILDLQKCQEEKENLKKLESDLDLKQELHLRNEHQFAKIQLQFEKQKEYYNETFQGIKKDLTKEQNDLIRFKAAQSELDGKIDKETDTIIEIVQKMKDDEKTTKRLQMEFKSKIESMGNSFISECGDMKKYIAKKCAL